MTVLYLIMWALPAIYVHALYAISLTAAQRRGLLIAIPINHPDALDKLDVLRRFSFESHLWRVLTFRNPWKIYPHDLADEVGAVS